MSLRTFFIAISIACMFAASARAGALDAPGEKKVTVKDEIQRGFNAGLNVEDFAAGPQAFTDAVDAIEDKNQQQRTDSDGFKLGVAFVAWQFNWQLVSSGLASVPVGGGERLDAAQVTASMANHWYQTFRAISSRLGVTSDDLKDLFGIHGYDSARDNLSWEAAFKAKAFKRTKPEK